MHDIEPYYHWRDNYIASEDERSPFHGCEYSEFDFSNSIYNYLIHPQWDSMGSPTLYLKVLYADYDEHFAIIEFIGEWNDCITNDVMHLKRNVIDPMIDYGIYKFYLVCENVLNFHSSDLCYYEEWKEEVAEFDGWIAFINTLGHVEQEMLDAQMHGVAHIGGIFSSIQWRGHKPVTLVRQIDEMLRHTVPLLH